VLARHDLQTHVLAAMSEFVVQVRLDPDRWLEG